MDPSFGVSQTPKAKGQKPFFQHYGLELSTLVQAAKHVFSGIQNLNNPT